MLGLRKDLHIRRAEKAEFLVGFHVSVSGGLHKAFERAQALGCTTFQIFTSNPRSWKPRCISDEEVLAFKRLLREFKGPVFSHLPYLANFCAKGELYKRSVKMLVEELSRCKRLGISRVVVHVGKLKGLDYREGVRLIAEAFDAAFLEVEEVKILMENTAGQGTEIGFRLEHLEDILMRSRFPERLALCFDTAHAFQAGYPVHERLGLDAFLQEIQKRFGLERLELIHLNDSKTPFASRVDRHWHIGEGEIGEEGFKVILSHPVLRTKPMVMETPWGEEWDRENMRRVRRILKTTAPSS